MPILGKELIDKQRRMIKLSKFCGGIKLDDTFKIIKGIIVLQMQQLVDATKAVSTCGQRWDGALFTVE